MTNTDEDWFSDQTATFGDRVAGAREALNLTQEDLSKKLGVKLRTIIAWEEDLAEPRSNKLMRLSGILNVSIMWLLNGEGDGIDAPQEVELPADVIACLAEMRDLKVRINQNADALSRLEKRLRLLLRPTE